MWLGAGSVALLRHRRPFNADVFQHFSSRSEVSEEGSKKGKKDTRKTYSINTFPLDKDPNVECGRLLWTPQAAKAGVGPSKSRAKRSAWFHGQD